MKAEFYNDHSSERIRDRRALRGKCFPVEMGEQCRVLILTLSNDKPQQIICPLVEEKCEFLSVSGTLLFLI